MDDLDLNWIDNYEQTQNLYAPFYKQPTTRINIKFIYITHENYIYDIKNSPYILTDSTITKDELMTILKKNIIYENTKHTLLSILKYNLTTDPEDITKQDKNDYLTVIKNIDEIYFEDTIQFLSDINELIILFYEKANENIKDVKLNLRKTRKAMISNSKTSQSGQKGQQQ